MLKNTGIVTLVLLFAFCAIPAYANETSMSPEENCKILSEQKIDQGYDEIAQEDIDWNNKFDSAVQQVEQAYQQYYAGEIDITELNQKEQDFYRELYPDAVAKGEISFENDQLKEKNLELHKNQLNKNQVQPFALGDGENVYLPMPYEYQSTIYNCGPATAVNIVNGYGKTSITQDYAAQKLGTTTNGTNFGNNWKNILNYATMGKNYNLAWGYDNWAADLANKSISTLRGRRGVVLNTYMTNSSNYLPGYSYGTIGHYIAAYGFDSRNPSYRKIRYLDPNKFNNAAKGAHTVSYQLMGRATAARGIVY